LVDASPSSSISPLSPLGPPRTQPGESRGGSSLGFADRPQLIPSGARSDRLNRDDIEITEEIEVASGDAADALRRRQVAAIAAFLSAVQRNRERTGVSVPRGSLHVSDRSSRRAAER